MHRMDEVYRITFEQHCDGIFLFNERGQCIGANAAAERIAGYPAQEISKLTFQDFYEPDQQKRIARVFASALEGQMIECETAIIRKNGERADVQLRGGPIKVKRLVTGVYVCLKDVTSQKRTEEERVRKIEELTAQVQDQTARLDDKIAQLEAADQQLRSLPSLLTMAEYRERERIGLLLHDTVQQLLVGIKFRLETTGAVSEEINALITQAIKITRSLSVEMAPSVLHRGLIPSLEWLSRWMKEKLGFTVELSIADVPPVSEAFTVFVFQAVRELIFNAAKYAKVPSARVSLGLEKSELRLCVEDSGVGFDPSHHSEELESFGLVSISERISLLGGRFEINSAPGEGSRFVLTMPLSTKQ